jgi:hypothetical protein
VEIPATKEIMKGLMEAILLLETQIVLLAETIVLLAVHLPNVSGLNLFWKILPFLLILKQIPVPRILEKIRSIVENILPMALVLSGQL